MFNSEFDEPRKMLKFIQESSEPMLIQLNALNPNAGGPGVNARDAHLLIGQLAANVHNLVMVVGKVVDYLDEQHPTS